MALSAFDDKSKEPQAMELQGTLGRSSAHWEALVAHIGAEFAPLDMNWNFAGVKWGWSLPSAILAIIDEAPKYAEGRGPATNERAQPPTRREQ